eukprot:4944650-Amphidinium_carterae.1
MGTVGRTGGPVGLELGAGFIFATGTKESITDCGGGLNPGERSLGYRHLQRMQLVLRLESVPLDQPLQGVPAQQGQLLVVGLSWLGD